MCAAVPELSAAREALASQIINTLDAGGFQAFLVGGCVRDRLLRILPEDFDVVTDARPEQVLELFPYSEKVGAHFGVVLVKESANVAVEVATFRSESGYSDGRRPTVVHFETNAAADVERRDFTVNGLLQDPRTGTVLDYVHGQEDLQRRLIRAIGDPDRRFEEDRLRMLRAVRFAARLGFTIEERTLAAIRRHAPTLLRISAERIRDELLAILTQGNARRGFELLDDSGLLSVVLPEVKAMQGVQQPPEFHPEGDVWIHVLMMLEQMRRPTTTLAVGVLLHDVGKPPTYRVADRIRFDGHAEQGAQMTRDIMERLRMPNAETDQITSLVANHMRFKDVTKMRVSTLKRFLGLPHFDEHLELHRLDCQASNGYTHAYHFVSEKLAEFGQQELKPQPLINGKDLIARGYKPGPAFREALDAVHTAQLEGEVHTKEKALILAVKVLEQSGSFDGQEASIATFQEASES